MLVSGINCYKSVDAIPAFSYNKKEACILYTGSPYERCTDVIRKKFPQIWIPDYGPSEFFIEEEADVKAFLPGKLQPYYDQIEAFKNEIKMRNLSPVLVYAFEERGAINFWIIIKKEQFRDRLEYAKAFYEVLNLYPDSVDNSTVFDEVNFKNIYMTDDVFKVM